MTLICRPVGRGNWAAVSVTFRAKGPLVMVRVGDRFTLGGTKYRVASIQP